MHLLPMFGCGRSSQQVCYPSLGLFWVYWGRVTPALLPVYGRQSCLESSLLGSSLRSTRSISHVRFNLVFETSVLPGCRVTCAVPDDLYALWLVTPR